MTRHVITIAPTANIEVCMRIMAEEHIHHLPVANDNQPVEMISNGNVIKGLITVQEFAFDQMENFISGGGYNQKAVELGILLII